MTTKASDLVVHLNSESVNAIPLGILRGTPDRRITYLNRAAKELIGPDFGVGARLEDLEFAPESAGVVEANLKRRYESQSATTYEIAYIRRDLDTCLRVQISGLPEYDVNGALVGSLGFVIDRTMEHANVEIHEAIGRASNPQALLAKLDEAIRDVIAFDSIVVSLISADRSVLRIFYERPDRTSTILPSWRWWPMPAFVSADLDGLLIARPDDIVAMFDTSPYKELAETDAATREWLKLGYRHMLRKPVMLDGRLVALATLIRKADRPFSAMEVSRLDQLPIGETINIALALEQQAELEFALKLISHLGEVAQSIAEVGRVLVEEIRATSGGSTSRCFASTTMTRQSRSFTRLRIPARRCRQRTVSPALAASSAASCCRARRSASAMCTAARPISKASLGPIRRCACRSGRPGALDSQHRVLARQRIRRRGASAGGTAARSRWANPRQDVSAGIQQDGS